MKNIEKYPNTADAVKAWKKYRADCNQNIKFEMWLGFDYIEPPCLLEAAKAVMEWMMSGRAFIDAVGIAARDNLTAAIKAEEARLRTS